MIDFDSFDISNISDEMLAANIDGNASTHEVALIESHMGNDDLSELLDIVDDLKNDSGIEDFDEVSTSNLDDILRMDINNEFMSSFNHPSFPLVACAACCEEEFAADNDSFEIDDSYEDSIDDLSVHHDNSIFGTTGDQIDTTDLEDEIDDNDELFSDEEIDS